MNANGIVGGTQRSWWAQAFQNRLIALVLAMIVAVPLLAAPADYSMTGVAALTLESFSVLLLAVLLWRARFDLRRENLLAFVRTSANVPILLLLGWVTLSCFLSPYKVFSVQSLLQIGAGALLYFAVAYQFRQSKHLSLLADVLLFLCLAVALGGLAQYQFASDAEGRAQAVFGDSQALGSFIALMLPIVAGLAFFDTKPKRQTIAQISFVLMIGSLLLTQNRSAWLASLVSLSLLAALQLRASKGNQAGVQNRSAQMPLKARKHQLVLPVLIAVISLGFVAAMNTQNSNVLNRATTFSSLGTDASWQARVQNHWKGSVEMIAQRPLLGWGAGLYPIYQHKYTGQGEEISPTGTGTRVSLAEQAHNYYLQTAVELGLPGLAITLAVLVCFWVSSWKRLAEMDAGIRRTLLMASVAATAGFAVDAVGSPSWQYAQTTMFLWLALGMGTSCLRPRLRREEHESEVAAVAPARLRRIHLVTRPAAAMACLGLATLLPTAYSAAQTFDYGPGNGPKKPKKPFPGNPNPGPPGGPPGQPNPGPRGSRRGNSARNIAFGVGALAALGYAISSLGSGGGHGAGAGGAGGAGTGGAGDGGTGAGGATGGSDSTMGAAGRATPTPTPTAPAFAPAR